MKHKVLIAFIFAVSLLGLLPWAVLAVENHGLLHVPAEIMDDSVYYYTRMHAVAQGHPFIGNPYFKEHTQEIAAAFFGADWVAALPLLAGIPLFPSILIDIFVWFGIFAGLTYLLARMLSLSRAQSMLLTVAALLPAYWYLERPVAMQIVFPAFMLFLITYSVWLKKPNSVARCIGFVLASAITFYLYTYLWQVVTIVLGLMHVLLLTKKRKEYLSLLAIDFCTGVLIIPLVWYTVMQLKHPWYWETMTRIGFIQTHTFGSAAVLSLAVVILCGAAYWLLRREWISNEAIFFGITGAALTIATFSNVITGKDLELAVHIGRFVYLWAAILCAYLLMRAAPEYKNIFVTKNYLRMAGIVIAAGILAALLFSLVENCSRLAPSALSTQAYQQPLTWLNTHTPPGSVIFADDSLSYYVPLMTQDYVLFQPDGGISLMPDAELDQRYLASRLFTPLSLTDIENDFRLYAGVGNSIHQYKTANRNTEICHILRGSNCGTMQTAVSYRGEGYFEGLYAQYSTMEKDPAAALQQYGVSYIVKDDLLDPSFEPAKLPGAHLVADMGRFQIYATH